MLWVIVPWDGSYWEENKLKFTNGMYYVNWFCYWTKPIYECYDSYLNDESVSLINRTLLTKKYNLKDTIENIITSIILDILKS